MGTKPTTEATTRRWTCTIGSVDEEDHEEKALPAERPAAESVIARHEDALVRRFAVHDHDHDHVALQATVGATAGRGVRLRRRPLSRGASIGRYLVLDRLGAGGMGEVYAAYDPELDRRVAVKLLLRASDRTEAHARLTREAQALAKLNHPNVVTVHDVGTVDERIYVAMELVDGTTLTQWLGTRERDRREVLRTFISAGRGLAAAHAKGLVHRDFKPDNVMVGDDGRVRVMDFGLARSVEGPGDDGNAEELPTLQSDVALDTPLTGTGSVMGTPRFMAPEQWAGLPTDARTDQFSFCVALYQALYRIWPFAGDSVPNLMRNVTEHNLQLPPARGRVPAWVRRAVLRGLAVEPDDRWPEMDPLLLALDRDPALRRRRWIGAGLIAAAGLGLGLVGGRSEETESSPCAQAGASVQEVWNVDARQRVADALRGTEVVYAEQTLATVHARLDTYAERLDGGYVAACRDTRVLGRQSDEMLDRRVICLDERLYALTATIDVLTRSDAASIGFTQRLVGELPGVTPCNETDRLRSGLPLPPPPLREPVDRVRNDITRALTLSKAGRSDEALALAERTVEASRDLDYRPLRAEALHARADAIESLGRLDEARAGLEAAFFEARAAGHDDVATDVSIGLVFLLASVVMDLDAAEVWARHARAEAERRGTPTQRGKFHNNYGSLLHERRDFEGARREHERAMAYFSEVFGERSEAVASALNNIGSVQMSLGDTEGATESFRKVVAIRKEVLGDRHPILASAYNNLAAAQFKAGALADAQESLALALEIRTAVLPPDHPDLAASLQNLSAVLTEQGRIDEAIAMAQRVIEILGRAHGPEHSELVVPLFNHAYMLREQGELDRAVDELLRAKAIAEAHPDVAPTLLPGVLQNLGATYAAQGRFEPARQQFERTVAMRETLHGEVHVELVQPLIGLSEAYANLGDTDAAIEHALRSTDCADATQIDPSSRGEAYYALAQALWRANRRDDSREALATAKRTGRPPIPHWTATSSSPSSGFQSTADGRPPHPQASS